MICWQIKLIKVTPMNTTSKGEMLKLLTVKVTLIQMELIMMRATSADSPVCSVYCSLQLTCLGFWALMWWVRSMIFLSLFHRSTLLLGYWSCVFLLCCFPSGPYSRSSWGFPRSDTECCTWWSTRRRHSDPGWGFLTRSLFPSGRSGSTGSGRWTWRARHT